MNEKETGSVKETESVKKKKRRNYPSKTTINLLYKEKDAGKDLVAVLLFLVFMVLLAVFTKLMVIDQLAKVGEAERAYHEVERQLEQYKEINQDYAAVEEEYSHYGNDFQTVEETNRQDRAAMLAVIDQKVKVDSGILNIQIAYNTATLTIEKTTLAEVSSLVAALEESSIVEYVAPSTAATNTNNRQVLSDGTIIVEDNTVKAVLVVQFKSMVDTSLSELEEIAALSAISGQKISDDVAESVSDMVDNAVDNILGSTAAALRGRREVPGNEE